jgi:hypothetical protein
LKKLFNICGVDLKESGKTRESFLGQGEEVEETVIRVKTKGKRRVESVASMVYLVNIFLPLDLVQSDLN